MDEYKKCEVCGTSYDSNLEKCPVCNGSGGKDLTTRIIPIPPGGFKSLNNDRKGAAGFIIVLTLSFIIFVLPSFFIVSFPFNIPFIVIPSLFIIPMLIFVIYSTIRVNKVYHPGSLVLKNAEYVIVKRLFNKSALYVKIPYTFSDGKTVVFKGIIANHGNLQVADVIFDPKNLKNYFIRYVID